MSTLATFELLRPMWLLALAVLPLLWWLQRRGHARDAAWTRAVDPHLLPHLLQATQTKRSHAPLLALAAATLAVLALAGPSWRALETPLWQQHAPLVIALDLSSAMRATDLKPSRIAQARAKLATLLERRRGGQVGLLAYSGDAFMVAPVTHDANTVKVLLDSLDPQIMPVDGQRADRAIRRAESMLRHAGFVSGDILVLSDRVDAGANAAAASAREAGFAVSVLGVGTASGAPVAGPQGFERAGDGSVRFARLDAAGLAALAASGGGRYAALTADAADLERLGVLDPQGRARAFADDARERGCVGGGCAAVQRSDDGYWLLLALLPLALLGFRRGALAVLPLVLASALIAPTDTASAAAEPEPAPAVSSPMSERWASLWRRDDQRARAALEAGEHARARELAPDPVLRGAAAYREQDYAAAAEEFAVNDSADAHYNRGNALARAGDYEPALAAYDAALARDPGMDDARANRAEVEKALQEQKKQEQQKQEQQKKDQQQEQGNGQPKPEDAEQGKDGEQQDPSEQQGEQRGEQDGEQGKDEQQPGSEGKSEDKPSEPSDTEQDPAGEQQPGSEPQEKADAKDEAAPQETAEQRETRAQAQQQANEAAKREMQAALEAAKQDPAGEQEQAVAVDPEQRARDEQEQAVEQWLRRVPDEPGGLLRRKFAIEYERRRAEGDD